MTVFAKNGTEIIDYHRTKTSRPKASAYAAEVAKITRKNGQKYEVVTTETEVIEEKSSKRSSMVFVAVKDSVYEQHYTKMSTVVKETISSQSSSCK